jgi:hypothetical protein
MNRITVAIGAIAALLSVACSRSNQPQQQASAVRTGQVGRYQLLYGEHEISFRQSNAVEKVILRIDTLTGDTDVFTETQGMDGGIQTFWQRIALK